MSPVQNPHLLDTKRQARESLTTCLTIDTNATNMLRVRRAECVVEGLLRLRLWLPRLSLCVCSRKVAEHLPAAEQLRPRDRASLGGRGDPPPTQQPVHSYDFSLHRSISLKYNLSTMAPLATLALVLPGALALRPTPTTVKPAVEVRFLSV